MTAFELKQHAYRSSLKSRALNVLIYLIDRANQDMTCFPAIPTIAAQLHISTSTVKRALKELEQAGYMQRDSRWRDNGGQSSNLYTLTVPVAAAPVPDCEDTQPHDEADEIDSPAPAPDHAKQPRALCPPVHPGPLPRAAHRADGAVRLSIFDAALFSSPLWTGEGVILRPP